MISVDSLLILVVVFAVIFFIGSFAKILREYERAVIFRLGRSTRAILNPGGQGNGPGLVLLVPLIDKMVRVSLQTVALDVAPQDVITRDNEAGGSRARAAGQGHQRRRRVPGGGEALGSGGGPDAASDRRPAPLSADHAGDRVRAVHDDLLPASAGPLRPAAPGLQQGWRRAEGVR